MSTTKSWGQRLRDFLFVDTTLSSLLVLILCVSGVMAFNKMIKEALPDLKIPMASITTFWHGSPGSVMEKEVTDKIEEEIRELDNLKRYSSGSLFAHSGIFVEFEADANLQESINLLRESVDKAADKIPQDSKKPVVTQASMRNMPIANFILYGPVANQELDLLAKRLKKQLLRIPGISKVGLLGEQKNYIRVQLLSERLRAHNISPVTVARAIKQFDGDFPIGVYEGREQPLNIKAETAIYRLNQLANLSLGRNQAEKLIRLKDVAKVEQALYRPQSETYYSLEGGDYTKGIGLSLLKANGKDTIKLVAAAKQLLKREMAQSNWPRGVKYSIVSNNAEIIEQELDKTLISGMQSVVVVFLVLFFLLSWREATVAALSIPITFLGSIIALWLMGYTFNVMVIIGMVVALGLLVDDFILVMEGMHDGMGQKLSFSESAAQTIKRYAIPSLSGTITTILIFVPLANISGIDGKFIKSIPVTAAVCLVVSYLVSIFISIPLSKHLLQKGPSAEPWIDRVTRKAENSLRLWLQTSVLASRRRVLNCLAVAATILSLGLSLILVLPVVLYPLSDGRNMGITIELPINYKLEESREVGQKLAKALQQKDYLSSVLMVVGKRDFVYEGSAEDRLSSDSGSNMVGFTILYKPKAERDKLAYEYAPELRRELQQLLADVPGHRLLMTSETGASTLESPIQINISGPDIERLQEYSQQLQKQLKQIEGVFDVRDNLGQSNTEAIIVPRQEILDRYGLTAMELNQQLTFYMGDHKITKLRNKGMEDDQDIRLETYWPSKQGKLGGPETWQEWQRISILSPRGEWLPLQMLVDIRYQQLPLTISHKNGLRNVTIMAETVSIPVNDIRTALEPKLNTLTGAWPNGYSLRWSGEVELAEETYGSAQTAFIIALLAVFSVLVLQFRSFSQPLIILTTVAFGVCGVLFGFTMMAYAISFPAVIGVIALAGINVNDGIVLVDTMNRHLRSGMKPAAAASQGAADRLRPIVSTTLTTLVGLLPLAIAEESWRPLCAAIIFGEMMSTVAAMIVVPALYQLLIKPQKPGS